MLGVTPAYPKVRIGLFRNRLYQSRGFYYRLLPYLILQSYYGRH
ncbi:hypothetical protein RINTHM_9910 [Richelia intracellularis HM01]|nr:hypothetical protein RINTHM_9910 [Richelia intracellularis HM01]